MKGERDEKRLGDGNREQEGDQPLRLSRASNSQNTLHVICHLSPETYSLLLPCHLSETGITVVPEAEAAEANAADPQRGYGNDDGRMGDEAQISEFPFPIVQSTPEQGEKRRWGATSGDDGLQVTPENRMDSNRRWAPRTRLELPIRITWRDVDGHRHETQGMMRDLSETGIYFTAPLEVDTGNVMELR